MSKSDTGSLIIFSDLDGTLLDHRTYSHAEAAPALGRMRELGIPLILASSKTAAEIIPLREELGFSHCEAIVENGSGILEANASGDEDQHLYGRIQQLLAELPSRLRGQYQGFSDWTAEQVAERTGLSVASAEKGKQRRFSEPGIWLGSEEGRDEFIAAITTSGLVAQQGGRFLTLSFGGNKAERMMEITRQYSGDGKKPFVVALGDAPNDLAMIEQADLGVIIPNPAHASTPKLAGEASGRIVRAAFAGPKGWNQVLTSLLEKAEKY